MVPVLAFAVTQLTSLTDLEETYKANQAPHFDILKLLTVNQGVFSLAEADDLKSPDEFVRASSIVTDVRFRFEISRVKHELCLAALANGNPKAREEVKKTWDGYVLATGRRQPIGTIKYLDDRFKVDPAPKSIRDVFLAPDKAVERSSKMKSDEEVTKICADDQAVRSKDWSKLSSKEMKEIMDGDKKRKTRIIDLLKKGRVVTAEDFDHASLVLQHGSSWEDYALAHELSICSLLLGRQEAAWLCAATYDRMSLSAGYRQRYGTQYSSDGGGPFKLDAFDTTGIGDAERKAMHCPTLEQAKNRKWD
ncbi:MAG: hypothetical protein GC165_09730 [Armatimonadetes bacterium]|nr:hypothetical protein [Armatimonadota bacterium]MBS1728588.1 hypothetical protein [Armatimonadota bacterium]